MMSPIFAFAIMNAAITRSVSGKIALGTGALDGDIKCNSRVALARPKTYARVCFNNCLLL